MQTLKSEFLNHIMKSIPSFEWVSAIEGGLECIHANPDKFDYLLTITENDTGKTWNIVATHKIRLEQQSKMRADKQYIRNSLRNFYHLGF